MGWVGKKGVLELGNVPEDYGHRKSHVYGEIDSIVGARFLKHELQIQLMAENIDVIMQMMAHRLDTLEKRISNGQGTH